MIKRLTVILMVVMALVLVISCAAPAPTATPSPSPSPTASPSPSPSPTASPKPTATPTPTPTATAKPVELVMANAWAKDHPQVGMSAVALADRMSKATNGRVNIRVVHDAALLTGVGMMDGLRQQTADLGILIVAYWPNQLPVSTTLSATVDLRQGNKMDMYGATVVTMKLWDEFPQYRLEWDVLGLTPFFWNVSAPYVFMSKKRLQTFEDFKGIKVRAFGNYIPKLEEAAGMTPVAVATNDTYTALQTGVIDATMTDTPFLNTSKIWEVAKYLTITSPAPPLIGAVCGTAACFFAINNKSLAKLSAADKDTLMKVGKDLTWEWSKSLSGAAADAMDQMKAKGVTIDYLPQAELDKWIAKSPDWYSITGKALTDAGGPGTAFNKRHAELVDLYLKGELKP